MPTPATILNFADVMPSPDFRFNWSSALFFGNQGPQGAVVAAGIYVVRLTAGGRTVEGTLTVRDDPGLDGVRRPLVTSQCNETPPTGVKEFETDAVGTEDAGDGLGGDDETSRDFRTKCTVWETGIGPGPRDRWEEGTKMSTYMSNKSAVPWWAAFGAPLLGVPLLVGLLALGSPGDTKTVGDEAVVNVEASHATEPTEALKASVENPMVVMEVMVVDARS